MQLSDFPAALLLASQVGATKHHRQRADRNAAVARDASVAASICGAAASAHAEVASRLRTKLLAVDLDNERLADRVDELENERLLLIAHISSLLDEVDTLRSHAH